MEKLNDQSQIYELKSRLYEQEKLLKEIELIEREKESLQSLVSQIKEGINNTFECYYNTLIEVKEFFDEKVEFSNLTLKAKVVFDHTKFEDSFLSMFNRRGKISNIFPNPKDLTLFDDDDNFKFDEETYLLKVKYLFDYILSTEENNLKLKKSFTKQQAIEHLFNTSYTKIVYDLIKDGDSLTQMSPGKRGLVLIELFLEMSDDRHPILIDQPEDNLDNRTISKDLVEIIKKKKHSRQIIIVTHNANLVVLTDSENVIIANQDPQLQENENYRFEYISGALECDFVDENSCKLYSKGIRGHVCEILEGGKEAFEIREKKYGF